MSRDLGADLLDDAHRLVAEDVALVDERAEHLVEVQVRAAQAGRGDADDRVGGLLDRAGRGRCRRGRRACRARSGPSWVSSSLWGAEVLLLGRAGLGHLAVHLGLERVGQDRVRRGPGPWS